MVEMSELDENDVNFKLMRTELLRNRNRLLDSLKAAKRIYQLSYLRFAKELTCKR